MPFLPDPDPRKLAKELSLSSFLPCKLLLMIAMQHCAGQYYFQSSDGEPFTVVNADGPVDDDILSRGPSASPPNSIAGLGPNQVGKI
jgi:hypothetical protein